ncbi:PAS domain S-box-containing protein [Lishizhenia tianjinensis]|uniref:histidine kinase n=1 Tax=Lishizhenia tianjinensis TaxID=477690 RepID=A0A1I6Y8L4_9FLAO|nr:PAS domain S-box protein [Lishizhenia tianjinensis]SFT46730.1 PAS domain S-box-containing protein [Lishizhenia tianjinensis]
MTTHPILRNEENLSFINAFGIDGYWIYDLQKNEIIFASSLLIKLFGFDYLKINAIDKALKEINLNKTALAPYIEYFKYNKENKSGSINYITSAQNKLHFHLNCKHFTHEDGTCYLIGAHSEFNNEEKYTRNQLVLQQQFERYKFIIEGTDIGTWEWNIQTGETVFNEKWADIIGYNLEELGVTSIDTWIKFCHPDDLELSNQLIEEHIQGKSRIYDVEARMKHKNGDWIWVHDKGKVVSWTEDGKPEWMVGSHQDITDKIIAREQNKRFVDQAPIAIAMFNKNIEYLAASEKWISDYNIKDNHIIGKSHYEVFPEIGEQWKRDHQEALRGKHLKSEGELFLRADGTEQWVKWELKPWYYKDREIGGITMYSQDITVAKKAEEQLRISEETFRNNFENAAIGMAIVSPEGAFTKVNNSLCEMLGYERSVLLNLTFQEITHPDDLDKDLTLLKEVVNNQRDSYQMEKRYFHKNGEMIYIVLSVSVVRKADKTPLYFISQITDITPRVKAQISLRSTLSKLESIVNGSTQVSIIGTDADGKINLFNVGAENLLGYKKEEVLHKRSPEIIHKASEMEARSAELTREFNRPVNGYDVFVVVANEVGFESREWTYVRKDGSEFKVLLTVNPIREEGQIIGYVGIAVDISQLHEAQTQIKTLLELKQTQNERFSNFAYIVSHNLKTYTNNLTGLINLFVRQNKKEAENKVLKFLVQSIEGLSDTVEHLNEVLTISSENIDYTKITINHVLKSSINNLGMNAEKADVRILNKLEKEYYIKGINAYVESIFFNFISNALKYRDVKKDSYVEISAEELDRYIAITFTDNGLGINLEKHRNKLFGMYNTFHKHAEARGIGLFITHNQVEAMKGKIEVKSEIGKGTSFTVYLLKA